jgi:DNA-binding response OmpR family regulator
VIVLTGQNDRANAVRAIGLGAYDFFAKPFEPDLLALTIDRAVASMVDPAALAPCDVGGHTALGERVGLADRRRHQVRLDLDAARGPSVHDTNSFPISSRPSRARRTFRRA